MSILAYPIDDLSNLTTYLNIELGQLSLFLEKLKERGLFEQNGHIWFRHDLMRKCIERNLFDQI